MNEKEKKAIEDLKNYKYDNEVYKSIQIVLNLIEKQDKMIEYMAKMLVENHEYFFSKFDDYTTEDFIKYFEKKARE